jgi:hypothetical protein
MTTTYYTPKVEEFHIGFEFEVHINTGFRPTDHFKEGEEWTKTTWDYFDCMDTATVDPNDYRVKHLDRYDAESLGWEHDYNLEPIQNRETDPTFEGYSIEDGNKIFMLYLFNDGEVWIELVIGNAGHGFIFKGKLQNKSELRRLMIQLGIIDNK